MTHNPTDYHFSQDGLFVIPIEHLSRDGVDAGFRRELVARGALTAAAVDLFDAAFRTYWDRAADLVARAPAFWFPPRVQHVCVVTRPDTVRPYFQPFRNNSWLIYASDLDPEISNPEFAAYQLLHAERMGLIGEIVPTLSANLSYFLTLDAEAADAFSAGCRSATRPDAAGFAALADALPRLRRLHHETLKPPILEVPTAETDRSTGLVVSREDRALIAGLERAWALAAREAVARHRQAHASPSPNGGQRICDWLAKHAPPLLVTGEDYAIVWDPDAPSETEALMSVLAGVTQSAEDSILADLQVVGDRSRAFLDSLIAPDELVDPAPYITEGGLSYIHKHRKLVAYHLGSGENEARLWQASPPFERYMLAARTVHEWGHLAAESDWVSVPEGRRAEREDLEAELVTLFEAIYAGGPPQLHDATRPEVERLTRKSGSLGQGLLKAMLWRIEDFQANLLAREFLTPGEMDTYVRNNVSAHVGEYSPATVYHELLRLAYEFQYLRLSRIPDPLDWFYKSTWFHERFVQGGVVTRDQFETLVDTVGRICECYEIDGGKFRETGAG